MKLLSKLIIYISDLFFYYIPLFFSRDFLRTLFRSSRRIEGQKLEFSLESRSFLPSILRDERVIIIFRYKIALIFLIPAFLFCSNSNNATLPVRPERAKDRGAQDRVTTIMLDPAGDALSFAHALQVHIEQLVPGTRVILTRTANETVRPLQHANFANRLEVDLFLSLRCYEDSSTRPQLAMYTFSYGDYAPSRIQDLAFYTYDQAYLLASGTTQKYAHTMEDIFKKYAKQFDLLGSFSLPYKPLIGVKAPAIGIEIGLKNKQSWQSFVVPLSEAVAEIINASN